MTHDACGVKRENDFRMTTFDHQMRKNGSEQSPCFYRVKLPMPDGFASVGTGVHASDASAQAVMKPMNQSLICIPNSDQRHRRFVLSPIHGDTSFPINNPSDITGDFRRQDHGVSLTVNSRYSSFSFGEPTRFALQAIGLIRALRSRIASWTNRFSRPYDLGWFSSASCFATLFSIFATAWRAVTSLPMLFSDRTFWTHSSMSHVMTIPQAPYARQAFRSRLDMFDKGR